MFRTTLLVALLLFSACDGSTYDRIKNPDKVQEVSNNDHTLLIVSSVTLGVVLGLVFIVFRGAK